MKTDAAEMSDKLASTEQRTNTAVEVIFCISEFIVYNFSLTIIKS